MNNSSSHENLFRGFSSDDMVQSSNNLNEPLVGEEGLTGDEEKEESTIYLRGITMRFSEDSVEKAFQDWRSKRFENFSYIFYLIVALVELVQAISSLLLATNGNRFDLSTQKYYAGESQVCGKLFYSKDCVELYHHEEITTYRTVAIIHGVATLVLLGTFLVLLNRSRFEHVQLLLRRRSFRYLAAIGWASYVSLQTVYIVDTRWSRVTLLIVGVRVSLYVVDAVLLAGHRWPLKLLVSFVAIVVFCVRFVQLVSGEFEHSDASSYGVLVTKVYGCIAFTVFVCMLLFFVWQLELETRELFVLHLGLISDSNRYKQAQNPLSSANISTWLHSDSRFGAKKIRRPTMLLATRSAEPMSIPVTESTLGMAISYDGSMTQGGRSPAEAKESHLPWFFGSSTSQTSPQIRSRKDAPPGLPQNDKNSSSKDDQTRAFEKVVGDWAIPFKFITDLDRIAAGSSGQVFRGRYLSATVALKQIFTTMLDDDLDAKNLEEFANEVTTLSRLGNHPNIVQFLGLTKELSIENPRLFFVTAWCPFSLEQLLERGNVTFGKPKAPPPFPPKPGHLNRKVSETIDARTQEEALAVRLRLTDDVIVRMLRQIASGMTHLHENKVLHRDLKPGNVLLTKSFDAQICDFGNAYKWSTGSRISRRTAKQGTPAFLPPEVLRESGALESFEDGCAVDIWSFGVLCVSMYTRNRPFRHDNTWTKDFGFEFRRAVSARTIRPNLPGSAPKDMKKLLEHVLHFDVKKRKSFYKLLKALTYIERSMLSSTKKSKR